MRLALCCTITAALTAAWCTAAGAQSLSRVDLEFGAWLPHPSSTFTMGATGWINDRSGVAVRSFFWRGVPDDPNWDVVRPGIELFYNRRGFVGERTEVNFGVGFMWFRDRGYPPGRANWFRVEKMDLLFGRRFLDRISVKGGVGVITTFLSGLGIGPPGVGFKFLVTVPLGEL